VANVGVAVSLFLPWLSTGRQRNGFELATALGEIGRTFESGALRWAAAIWFVCPASVGVALLARGLGTTWALIAAAGAAAGAAVIGTLVWVQGVNLNMESAGSGPAVCAVSSTVAFFSVLLLHRVSSTEPVATN